MASSRIETRTEKEDGVEHIPYDTVSDTLHDMYDERNPTKTPLRNYLAPLNGKFGPEYSSDDSGDGPPLRTRTKRVPPDGDCLYHCMADTTQDTSTPMSHKDIRVQVAERYNELDTQRDETEMTAILAGTRHTQEGQSEDRWKEMIQRTRTSATSVEGLEYGRNCWGGDTECATYANMRNMTIVVREERETQLETGETETTQYWLLYQPTAGRTLAKQSSSKDWPKWTQRNQEWELTTTKSKDGTHKILVMEHSNRHYNILEPLDAGESWVMTHTRRPPPHSTPTETPNNTGRIEPPETRPAPNTPNNTPQLPQNPHYTVGRPRESQGQQGTDMYDKLFPPNPRNKRRKYDTDPSPWKYKEGKLFRGIGDKWVQVTKSRGRNVTPPIIKDHLRNAHNTGENMDETLTELMKNAQQSVCRATDMLKTEKHYTEPNDTTHTPTTDDFNMTQTPATDTEDTMDTDETTTEQPSMTQQGIYRYTKRTTRDTQIQDLIGGWEQRTMTQLSEEDKEGLVHHTKEEERSLPPPGTKSETEPTQKTTTMVPLVCVAQNVRGYRQSAGATVTLMKKRPHVIISVDTKLTAKHHRHKWMKTMNKGYRLFHNTPTTIGNENDYGLGVTVAVSEEITGDEENITPKDVVGRMVVLRLLTTTSNPVTLVAVYSPHDTTACDDDHPVEKFNAALAQVIQEARKRGDTILLGGDFNAVTRPTDRSSGKLTTRDTKWAHFTKVHGIRTENNDAERPHTYTADHSPSTSSRIDDWYTWERLAHTINTKVTDVEGHTSDHVPVTVTMDSPDTEEPQPPPPTLNMPTPEQWPEIIQQLNSYGNLLNQAHEKLDGPGTTETVESVAALINDYLNHAMDITKSVCGETQTREKGTPQEGRRPWMNRKTTKEYNHEANKCQQAKRLQRYLSRRQRKRISGNWWRTAKQMEKELENSFAETHTHWEPLLRPVEVEATYSETNHASLAEVINTLGTITATSRKKARNVIKAHQDENKQKYAKTLQKTLQQSRKKGHKMVMSAGEEHNTLEAVYDSNGRPTRKREKVVRAVEAHFEKVHAPMVSPSREAVRNPPWRKGKTPVHLPGPAAPHEKLATHYSRGLYDKMKGKLPNNKAAGPDGVKNEILKGLPPSFHDATHKLFELMLTLRHTPSTWKNSNTVLPYKKGDPYQVKNYRPIALAKTVYKLWTSILTELMTDYAETQGLLTDCQEGFRRDRSTTRQIQMLTAALEDAKITKQDIMCLYIDFTNAFGSVDHPRLIHILTEIGFPQDAVDLIADLYQGASTVFLTPAGSTTDMPIHRGTLQGDAISPFLFLCFIEPLLRWMEKDKNNHYTFKTSKITMGPRAYADDIAILTHNAIQMNAQVRKLQEFGKWAGLEVNIPKCAITAALHGTKACSVGTDMRAITDIVTREVHMDNKTFPPLGQSDPFKYLGIRITADLKWGPQVAGLMEELTEKARKIMNSSATRPQKLQMATDMLTPKARYGFKAGLYTLQQVAMLQSQLHEAMRSVSGMPKYCPIQALVRDTKDEMGMGWPDLLSMYISDATDGLQTGLHDPGTLGLALTGLVKKYTDSGHQEWDCRGKGGAGPVLRTLRTFSQQKGARVAGEIAPTAELSATLGTLKHGGGWCLGAIMSLKPGHIKPILLLGIEHMDELTHTDGKHILTVEQFRNLWPNAGPSAIKAYRKVREAVEGGGEPVEDSLRVKVPSAKSEPQQKRNGPPGADTKDEPESTTVTTAPPPKKPRGLAKTEGLQSIERWTQPNVALPTHPTELANRSYDEEIQSTQNDADTDTRMAQDPNITPSTRLPPQPNHHSGEKREEYPGRGAGPSPHKRTKENDPTPTHQTPSHTPNRTFLKINFEETNPDTVAHPTGKIEFHRKSETIIVRDKRTRKRREEIVETAEIRNPQGQLEGKMPVTRLHQLWRRFEHTENLIRNNMRPPIEGRGSFAEEVVQLLQRYKSGVNSEKSAKGTVKIANHWACPKVYMEAFRAGCGIRKETFASPLNVKQETEVYCSAFEKDEVFGAHWDANKWSLAEMPQEVNPEYEAKELYSSLKRMIRATYTDSPVLSVAVYPKWKQHPYRDLLHHPRVHRVHTVPQPYFSFDLPEGCAERAKSGNANWDVIFLIVANDAGLRAHLKWQTLSRELKRADKAHCGRMFRTDRPEYGDSVPHKVCQPLDPDLPPMLTTSPSGPTPETPEDWSPPGGWTTPSMRFSGSELYTDGSFDMKKDTAGSGVWDPTTSTATAAQFTGEKGILRAELVAILLAAQQHEVGSEDICVDSLSALLLIWKEHVQPGTLRNHTEGPLVTRVLEEFANRPDGHTTRLHKVPAHVGVEGNEMADDVAKAAANGHPRHGEVTLVEVEELPSHAKVWLETPSATKHVTPWVWRTAREDKSALYDKKRRERGYTPVTEIPQVLRKPTTRATTGLKLNEAVRVVKARYGVTATRRRQVAMGILPHGTSFDCPLCTKGEDTIGHRLLGCGDSTVSGMITNRHNWVVRYLAGVYMRGKRGGWWCLFNAGAEDRGSSTKTIPEWLLESGPAQPGVRSKETWKADLVRAGARVTPKIEPEKLGRVPDIVIVKGVRPGHGLEMDHWAGVARPDKLEVQILEVGYARDDDWQKTVRRKTRKYKALVTLLRERGWTVDFRTLVLGATGVVYEHTEDVLEWLGVDTRKERASRTDKIAKHGAKGATDILVAYEERLKSQSARSAEQ